jgi:molecular chaperone DnaK (HSP70)
MKCPNTNCGIEIPNESKFCSECGTKIPEKRKCNTCGFEDLPQEAMFCPECGKKLDFSSSTNKPQIENEDIFSVGKDTVTVQLTGIALGKTISKAALWKNNQVVIIPESVSHSATEYPATVLKKLKQTTENYLQAKVKEVIITMPSHSHILQLQGIKEASEIAGLECRRTVSVTLAIALAHYYKKQIALRVAVLYLENGNFDVSIMEIGGGVYEVKSVNGCNTNFNFTDYNSLVKIVTELCNKSLNDSGLKNRDIDEVLFAGSFAQIPTMQQSVEQIFSTSASYISVSDDMPAIGAAVQGGILTGNIKDVVLLDVIPLSIGIETAGGVMIKLIEANSTIPTKKSETFTTILDNQSSVEIHVLQGEQEKAVDNVTIGRFHLDGIPPAPKGVPQIEVTFDIDANGILNVSARDQVTGKKISVKIQ